MSSAIRFNLDHSKILSSGLNLEMFYRCMYIYLNESTSRAGLFEGQGQSVFSEVSAENSDHDCNSKDVFLDISKKFVCKVDLRLNYIFMHSDHDSLFACLIFSCMVSSTNQKWLAL